MEWMLKSFTKERRFADLADAVQYCTLCTRLCGRTKVLSCRNGDLDSAVVFVAEAPGRLGADRTGIPLYGDQTGNNFERLLGSISWKREDVFITNALLCNPRQEDGNNGTPTSEEIANCATYLEMTLELIDPEVIVTLGDTALKAMQNICRHSLTLRNDVAKPTPWAGRLLVPMYHPGPRALVHRGFAKQTSDFMKLAKLVRPRSGVIRRSAPQKPRLREQVVSQTSAFQHLLCLVVKSLGKMTYFRLTKLLYLIDLTAIEKLGRSITGEIYLRQPEGPWPPALKKVVPALKGREITLSTRGRIPMVEPGPSPRFTGTLDDAALEVVAEVLERYGRLSNAEIKSAAYQTSPMRYLLAQERQGRDVRRIPVVYQDKCAPETDPSGR